MRLKEFRVLWKKLNKEQVRLLVIFFLMWCFWHFVMFSPAGYTIRRPVEFMIAYFIIVVIPTAMLGILIEMFIEKRWPGERRLRAKIAEERKVALQTRLKEEEISQFFNNIGMIIIFRVIGPLSWKLVNVFPRTMWIREFHQRVARRIFLTPIAFAISRPLHKKGYYLQIIDYLMDEKEVSFVLSPVIGIVKARSEIKKRLAKFNPKMAKRTRYVVNGWRLHVVVPMEMVGLKT